MVEPTVTAQDLFESDGRVISWPGTSQYSRGGLSACGLAAMNCLRVLLAKVDMEHGLFPASDLLETRTMDTIIALTRDIDLGHLELEDIYKLPLFNKTLSLVGDPEYAVPNLDGFRKMLQTLDTNDDMFPGRKSRGVIITRPPEIVACLKLATAFGDLFVLFDSHPRPRHPLGSAFVCTPSAEKMAIYLSELMQFDPSLLEDSSWEAQLLASASFHYFVAAEFNSPLDDLAYGIIMQTTNRLLKREIESGRARSRSPSSVEKSFEAMRIEDRRPSQTNPSSHVKHSTGNVSLSRHNTHGVVDAIDTSTASPPRTERQPVPSTRSSRRISHGPPTETTQSDHSMRTDGTSPSRIGRRQPGFTPGPSRPISNGRPRDVINFRQSFPPDDDDLGYVDESPSQMQTDLSETHTESHIQTHVHVGPEREEFILVPERLSTTESIPSSARYSEDSSLASRALSESSDRVSTPPILAETSEGPTCPLCAQSQHPDLMISLWKCGHECCRDCLRAHTQEMFDEGQEKAWCPTCLAFWLEKRVTGLYSYVDSELARELGVVKGRPRSRQHEPRTRSSLRSPSPSSSKTPVPVKCPKCRRAAYAIKEEEDESPVLQCPLPDCQHFWCKRCWRGIPASGPHQCVRGHDLGYAMFEPGVTFSRYDPRIGQIKSWK